MNSRNGLSLIEVMIAMTILVGSAAVLSQLIDVGQRHATRATEISEAQAICQNLMVEILSGTRVWEESRPQAVDPFVPWDFSVRVEPLGIGDLVAVSVTVSEQQDLLSVPAQTDLPTSVNPREYRLVRWVRRPLNSEMSGDTVGFSFETGDWQNDSSR
ncbi:MAG: prepilin-type N-terminal cleavage/methylation domain-containing protein [Planctomycetaceae bacterium]|nr:prepilin-type N-terminal cleavage/methylation domain-containing protein [Planctomycetaceae bacterium]